MLKRFWIIVLGLLSPVLAEIKKVEPLSPELAPQVYMADKKFSFDDISLSLLRQNKRSHLIFNMVIYRKRINHMSHEFHIPVIVDTIISDLTPAIQIYWHGEISGIQRSLEKRLNYILKGKFKWIDYIVVNNVRIQD